MTNNTTSEDYKTIGNYDENEIEFYESDKLKSRIYFNLNSKKLIKENIDYKIEIDFSLERETECLIILKKEERELRLKVKTLEYRFENNELFLLYNIIDNEEFITYKISIGG